MTMKKNCFCLSLSCFVFWISGLLFCLTNLLPVKAQDEFTALAPAAVSYSNPSSAGFPAPVFQGRGITADFDADGDTDILYQNGTNGSPFRYARNNGNAAFTVLAQSDSPFSGVTLPDNIVGNYYPANYDTDGDIDLWVGANATTGSYFRNDGSSFSLQSSATFPAATFVARNKVADFDSDGDTDILYQTGADGTAFRFARNNGNAAFTDLAQTDSPFAGVTLQNILGSNYYLGDYDGDTDVDIWVALNNTTGSYFMQNDRPPFIASSNPADNAVNVPVGADISITFNETVTKGAGSIRIVRISDNAIVETIPVLSAQVTGANANYTINPTINFAPNTAYAVRFDAGTFRDADGAVFPGILNNTQLSFTTLPTTAATVSLTGRALTISNQGIANASIIMVNSHGETRFARTNPFGYYRFDNLEIGTYVVTIQSKRYEFTQNSHVLTIIEDMENFNFVSWSE